MGDALTCCIRAAIKGRVYGHRLHKRKGSATAAQQISCGTMPIRGSVVVSLLGCHCYCSYLLLHLCLAAGLARCES